MELAVLIAIGLILAIITVVGHGIWVFLALLFRGGKNSTKPEQRHASSGRQACPRCSTPLGAGASMCDVCGWPLAKSEKSTSSAALRSLREQVARLSQLGLLDEVARDSFLTSITEQDHRLAEKPATVPPVNSPSPASSSPRELSAQSTSETPTESIELTPIVPEPVAPPPIAASPQSLAQRAERYAASRAAATAEIADSLASSPPPKPREAFSRILASFMEEKNIRWGELVGGLLIVGCSLALVISFWAQIAEKPVLRFGLFNGVTAALFAVGLYTDRRWKIHTTSHGVLVIATLLVPLNFLAIAAFTQESPPTDILSLGGEAISLALFAALVYFAGRILVPGEAWLLAASVMVPCLMQLLVRRFADSSSSLISLYGLATVPLAAYVGSTLTVIKSRSKNLPLPLKEPPLPLGEGWGEGEPATTKAPSPCPLPEGEGCKATSEISASEQSPPPPESAANRLLTFLGLASAAAVAPLALLLHNVPPFQSTLHWLSPLLIICGLPALLTGLWFWRKLKDRNLAYLQTAGIAVGVVGVLCMAAAAVLAWPDPALLLPTLLTLAAVLLFIALWFGIPEAHIPAGLALAAAWLVGFYVLRGDVGWIAELAASLRELLLSATSGHALVPLVALFGGLAVWLRRRDRDESLMYAIVAASVAVASLALVMWFGFARAGDPHHATWTISIYALAALAAAATLDRDDLATIASALLLAALVQAIVFRFGDAWQLEHPWIVALLAHATIAATVGGLLQRRTAGRAAHAPHEFIVSALITSFAAAAWSAVAMPSTSADASAVNFAWLAAVWIALSVLGNQSLLFAASQVAVVIAILCGVTAAVQPRPWYSNAAHPWLEPWFLIAQGIALSAYCLAMSGIRYAWGRHPDPPTESTEASWKHSVRSLLDHASVGVDQVIEVALVLLVVSLTTYAVWPGVAQELSPNPNTTQRIVRPLTEFQIAQIDHTHAAGLPAWTLLAAVATVLIVRLRHLGHSWRLAGLILVSLAICPLIAAHFEPQVAVASALRWTSAAWFAILSIAVWLRGSSTSDTMTASDLAFTHVSPPRIRDLLVALTVLIYVLLGMYVSQAALDYTSGLDRSFERVLPIALAWTLLTGAAGLLIGFSPERSLEAWKGHARNVLLLLAVAPTAALLVFALARILDAHPIVGPEPGTWFRKIGWDTSYGVPLAVIALVFIGYAIRDRSSAFAFAAGLLFNIVATIVVLLRLARSATPLDLTNWLTVDQTNAIVAGAVALAWLAALTWHRWREAEPAPETTAITEAQRWPLLLVTQVALAASICGTFLLPAALELFNYPRTAPAWVAQAGSPVAWLAVGLSVAAAVWLGWRRATPQFVIAYFAALLVSLIALTSLRWDTGNWLAYHVLLAGATIAAWVLPIGYTSIHRLVAGPAASAQPIRWSAGTVRAFGIVAVVLALRALEGDPARPWWTIAALLAIGARNVWIAFREASRGSMWVAGVLICIAASCWWAEVANQWSTTRGPGEAVEFVWINLIALAAMAIVSVWTERRNRISDASSPELAALPTPPRSPWLSFHRAAVWLIVAGLLATTGGGLIADLTGNSFHSSGFLAWATWLAALAAAVACWWDPAIRWPIPCLYCVGLIGVGVYLDRLDLRGPLFPWALANALAAYSLLTSGLWCVRDRLRAIAERFAVPATADAAMPATSISARWEDSGHGWLVSANVLLGAAVLLLVVLIEQTNASFTQRMVAAYAVGAQAFAIGLLAKGAVRSSLQYLALVWGALFAIAFGWAFIPPDFPATWLHRFVATIAALTATIVVYGFGIVKFLKRENEWTRAAAKLVPALVAPAALFLALALGIEVKSYVDSGSVPIAWPALVAVALALGGLAVAAIAAALLPGRDPLGLSERGRTAYVYAAEALAGLLFLHIRVTLPWLFRGWFLQFWPLVVMGIAFLGVGLSEVFKRRQSRILSEPLETTGALLPLLPVFGFWAAPNEVNYSLLLLSVGALYAVLSVLRKSFLYVVLAAVAANGSLWYLLHEREGLGLLEHPQLWLIPPALCALVAGYINRGRLTQAQSAALRYASAIVIYVSSTADVFINGVAEAPWLPAVLAGISILGVLAGIVLRVRAFLYLGTAFLVVAILTVIWHAAIEEQHTWILWVAGIVTGVLIIALFGLFEKRRDDVLRVVDQLKHWQA